MGAPTMNARVFFRSSKRQRQDALPGSQSGRRRRRVAEASKLFNRSNTLVNGAASYAKTTVRKKGEFVWMHVSVLHTFEKVTRIPNCCCERDCNPQGRDGEGKGGERGERKGGGEWWWWWFGRDCNMCVSLHAHAHLQLVALCDGGHSLCRRQLRVQPSATMASRLGSARKTAKGKATLVNQTMPQRCVCACHCTNAEHLGVRLFWTCRANDFHQ